MTKYDLIIGIAVGIIIVYAIMVISLNASVYSGGTIGCIMLQDDWYYPNSNQFNLENCITLEEIDIIDISNYTLLYDHDYTSNYTYVWDYYVEEVAPDNEGCIACCANSGKDIYFANDGKQFLIREGESCTLYRYVGDEKKKVSPNRRSGE